ncbi:MAG: response regulator transcription factor [Parvibaculaceae bacterium]|nr:response regulator transcription factor [Parvibaculaceae bacterium]
MSRSRTLMIVAGSDRFREALAEQLQLYEEFECVQAGTAAQALALIQDQRVDLIVLDARLPDMSGAEACRLLREAEPSVAVVLLTCAEEPAQAQQIAHDHLSKPFRFGALLGRIRSQLRARDHDEEAAFRIGGYEFRPGLKLLVDAGENRIRLTEKEAAILKYLHEAGERTIARDELLHEVWGYNSGITTHTLETHIYRLRQKIEADPSDARFLVTEPGGYRLMP